jgi:hypothetical protein
MEDKMQMTAKTSSGFLRIHTGREGPHHDPYSFTETTVKRNGNEITLHEGLGDWLSWNRLNHSKNNDARENFIKMTGFTPEKIRSFVEKANSTCKKCGCRHSHGVPGYPGETIYVCDKCENVVGADFCESEVM